MVIQPGKWVIEAKKKQNIEGGTLIAGLPGIGNVGKIVADFLIDEMKARKVCEFFSYHMPHSVYVREDNLVEMPKIALYFKEHQGKKLLILTGDSQPIDEIGCYSLCDTLLDFFQENKCSDIITLGGIGLQSIPKIPKVYCTGNNKKAVEKFIQGTDMSKKVYGVVGPIIGVSGVLLGLSEKRKINAVSVLAETFGHPMFLGLKGAKEILKVLDKKMGLSLDLKNLDKEIKSMESKMKIAGELGKTSKKAKSSEDVNYIG